MAPVLVSWFCTAAIGTKQSMSTQHQQSLPVLAVLLLVMVKLFSGVTGEHLTVTSVSNSSVNCSEVTSPCKVLELEVDTGQPAGIF